MDALERFRLEFRDWVRALNRVKGFNSSPEEVLERLGSRIPEAMLRQIGGAFINGWLINDSNCTCAICGQPCVLQQSGIWKSCAVLTTMIGNEAVCVTSSASKGRERGWTGCFGGGNCI